MKLFYTALTAFVFLFGTVSAQQFVNGSFESTYPNPGSCNYLHDTGLSKYTLGADTGFGTADNIAYFGMPGTSCNYGLAAEGSSYIALTSNNTKYDAIALKVNPAMQAGTTYHVHLNYKTSLSPPTVILDLGYSANNHTAGTLISTIPLPFASDTIWRFFSYNFTPTITCNWITVKAELNSLAGYSFVELDKFVMGGGPSGIEAISTEQLTVSPNPASDYVMVSGGNGNLDVNIADISGRVLLKNNFQSSKKGNKIDISSLVPGFYVMYFNDRNGPVVKKLQVLR